MTIPPELLDSTRREIHEQMRASPLVLQYLARFDSDRGGRPPSITEPWMALAEQQMFAGYVASQIPIACVNAEAAIRATVAAGLRDAATFSWTNAVFRHASTCPLPPHVIGRELLPAPITYHTMEDALGIYWPEGVVPSPQLRALIPEGAEVDGLLVMDGAEAFSVFSLVNRYPNGKAPDGAQMALSHCTIPYGKRYPDEIVPESQPYTRLILSMLAFLASPYIEVDTRKLPRAFRRHALAGSPVAEHRVAVVQLRRAAEAAVAAYEAAGHTLQHRHWVIGHNRAQWYPSMHAHKVIWIAPYLKGPEGAPLLDRVYRVQR